MNDIEKIKAEIKRLMKETDDSQFGIGGRCMCRIILDFIDSLSEEKPSDELEEAAENCVWNSIDSNDPTLVPKFIPLLLSLFISGAYWQKEQIMKDAVEGEVIYDLGGFFRIKSEAIDGAKYKVGSWVKLIIVKED